MRRQSRFQKEILKPKKLTGKFTEFSHELSASVGPGLESALSMDLADAVRAKMSSRLINGDESDGLLKTWTDFSRPFQRLHPFLGTESVASGDYASVAAQAVDGIHASSSESAMSVLSGLGQFTEHAASVYQASGSGESASEALRRKTSMRLQASSYIPAKNNSDVQNGNILHGGVGFARGDSVAAEYGLLWN